MKAELADGRVLEFPDGTDPAVIQRTVKKMMGAPQPQDQNNWSDVPGKALGNLWPSTKQVVSDHVQPLLHPIDTVSALGRLIAGTIEKAIPGEQYSEKYADAVGEYIANRYGGLDNVKETISTDPVGFLADVSTILTGGATLAAKAPGTVGKIAKTAGSVGRAIDPVNAAAKVAGATGKFVGKTAIPAIAGVMSGTGMAPIQEAAKAGYTGGKNAQAFQKNLRGGAAEMSDILHDAQSGLTKLRQNKSAAYRSGMIDISKDKTVLNFDDVINSYDKVVADNTFNGVPRSKTAAKALQNVQDELAEWMVKDPEIFHTPEGLDTLKQRIGDLVDWKTKGNKENRALEAMYNNIKGVIEDQAPTYAKTMQDYSEASKSIKEVEKSLSLGNNAMADTALRKLTSVMRNNVNTNYGSRGAAAEALQTASGKPLLPAIAGQSMNAWTPRGIQSLGTHAAVTGLAGGLLSPAAVGTLPLQSPRLVGEGAYYAGKAAAPIAKGSEMINALLNKAKMTPRGVAAGSFQAGRNERMQNALGGK